MIARITLKASAVPVFLTLMAVAAFAQLHRLFEGRDGGFPVARSVMGYAERVPVGSLLGRQFNGLMGQFDRPAGIAELGLGPRSQLPGQIVVNARVTWLEAKGLVPGGNRFVY